LSLKLYAPSGTSLPASFVPSQEISASGRGEEEKLLMTMPFGPVISLVHFASLFPFWEKRTVSWPSEPAGLKAVRSAATVPLGAVRSSANEGEAAVGLWPFT